jgi:hypothetical protein
MKVSLSGNASKKVFAREQFAELLKMGLSRRRAGELMREIGPRLSVPCLEWVKFAWQHVKEVEEDSLAKHTANRNYHVRQWAESASVASGGIQNELTKFIEEVLQALGASPEFDWQLVVDNFNSGEWGRFGQRGQKPLALPTSNSRRDLRIMLAAVPSLLPL